MAAKGYKGLGMNGFIASWYAKLTYKQIEDYKKDAAKVAAATSEGAAILEIAPGPGYLAIELAKKGNFYVAGLDISKKFVEIAQENARAAGVNIDFRLGNASQMPFESDKFDNIVCRAAFKNFSEPITALNEMYRVLKVGGQAVIIDLRGDVSWETMNSYIAEMGNTGFNALLTKWAFKTMLIKRAYTKNEFQEMIAKSDLQTYEIKEDGIGLEVYLQK